MNPFDTIQYAGLMSTAVVGSVLCLLLCLPAASPPPISATGCQSAKNTCPDYASSWLDACPDGARCIAFTNACDEPVALAYQTGCNGDGAPGAPQCDCTDGPILPPSGGQAFWEIVDGDYTSCLPSWKPACLTAGLAIIANETTAQCASGTRIEFTAGNGADPYNHFDSYNLDVEKGLLTAAACGKK